MIAAVIVAIASLPWLQDESDDFEFSKDEWAQDNYPDYPRRLQMTCDLVRHHLPKSLSRSEVESLLGPPDYVSTPANLYSPLLRGAEAYWYLLGDKRFALFSGDEAYLYVDLDASGNVIQAVIDY